MSPNEKTLGEILFNSMRPNEDWTRCSTRDLFEKHADAVRRAVEAQQPICQKSLWIELKKERDEWASKFHGAMELAKTHMQHASDYAKERDAYMKSYNDASLRCSELEQEIGMLKSPREMPVEKKTTQRDSLYVLIVRAEGGEDFSVCSFMQPTVTHSQMSAIVNILSEQLADGIGNLSEFQNKKESLQ